MNRLRTFLILALIALVIPLGASSAQSSETLVWTLVGGDITTLNWALITDGNSFSVAGLTTAGLFRADPDTGLPTPELATWEVSEDGLTYTFTLVDAAWSDGTPITANDVKFSYDAITNDVVASARKADVGAITSLEVVDDKTFIATVAAPNCTIWGNAFGALRPLPAHKFAADFSDFNDNAWNTAPDVVSGPYKFADRSAGEFIRLEVNENYFLGASRIPSVVFRILADPPTVNQALQTAEVDYAFMYPDQLAQIPDQTPFNTFLYPNNNTPLLALNWQDPENPIGKYDADGNPVELTPNKFFSDLRVRQAVAMGYDKAAIALTQGEEAGSVPLTGPVTPAFYGAYDMSAIEPWPYDPETAANLLEQAGWVDSDGDGIREKDGVVFEVDLVYSPLVDLWANIATVAQDQLGDIGIKVNVSTMEWSAYLENVVLPYTFDMTIVGFGGGTEIDGIAYNILHSKNISPTQGFNFTSYYNPRMDELLETARTLPGCAVEEREALYQELQQIAHDDVAYDFTVSTTQVHVLNRRVIDARWGQWNFSPIIEWGLGG